MKKHLALSFIALILASTSVFAEEHATESLKHAEHAVTHCQAGHAAQLVEHANGALTHAKKADEVATGEAKTHIEAGLNR